MTDNAGIRGSYWMDTAPGEPYPALDTDLTVDVAVVGAGIAGISTAWELARAGRSVALLEADRVAAGVTGHTTAKLSAQHTLIYDRLRRTRGAEAAHLYARSQSDAIEHAAALVDELRIDCDWEWTSAFTYTRDPVRLPEIRAEAEAAREAGLPAEVVTETDLPYSIAGAVRVAQQAQFHPRKYLLALVGELSAQGAHIHERTRIVGLEQLEQVDACRLTAETGARVTAGDVVIATHYPVFDRALLFTRLSPRRELVVAAPLPADRDPSGMYITPEEDTRSVRTAPYRDGERLLIVTGEHFTPGTGDTDKRFARLADWAEEHFPDIMLTHRWATQDNDSTDTVPLVGHLPPASRHAYVATGFGGWGMSGGIMAGRLLAGLITGDRPPWAELYDPRRLRSVLREAPAFLKHQAKVARHFVGDRLPSPYADSLADIAPGTGSVVRHAGQRCAVYRDEDGQAHAVSARCTHMGCLVAFNSAEHAWECPCHGSRFGTDGEVLQGPATRPLERRELREVEPLED
ncbi:FAD-dependent oxidoreductase [Streptomyces sporangiiformans]|uniref:FAD-dependent oxidoreductase n=1 Tax=Streptomyces sporangiiformans TaxID=2315329 RepID=A0A505D362_9ACTN|nr:FAD-dependent oxidoreductase [Streptomyces sporangiiformans]TPQ16125.1 FAD-dependent oxidoreductase [Streptomyces sporangiiformans]